MKTKYKVMILIGSALVIAFSLWRLCHVGIAAQAAEYQPGIVGAIQVATPGDANFQNVTRDITDVYKVLVLIAIEFMFWILWNIIRTVSRILTDFKKF